LIADVLLTNLQLLTNACRIFGRFCIDGIEANEKKCRQNVETSTAVLTAIVEKVGYQTAQKIAAEAKEQNKTVREIILKLGIMTEAEFESLISPQKVLMLGNADKSEEK
jgi:aspartate ammonia-lyase